jgi:transcriptional regulator with GAF, ATPase, and Fis domain
MDRWDSVINSESPIAAARNLLECLRLRFPFRSVAVFEALTQQRTLAPIAFASTDSTLEIDSISLSPSRWSESIEWMGSGESLRQLGAKRNGKLSWFAPNANIEEIFALPLRHPWDANRGSIGVAVLELEVGRAIREEQFELLSTWIGPLWLLLQMSATTVEPSRLSYLDDAVAGKEEVIGADRGLKSVMERVELVSPSDMPVLILGDTGTGKEVVARAIHNRSNRAGKPFVRVNCGAIPSELIDSQLFGHERGSFTGASEQRKGWFERADGGTLFLDEIGELSLAAQVRLLRVLQEHQIERVGGHDPIHVDVRIIAATHRDLATMVQRRSFREDLWYRINLFPILLPTLAERAQDIPEMASHFAKRAANKFGLHAVELSPTDIKRLTDYRWPGNIRELQAVMDRAVILGRGTRLDIENSLGTGTVQRFVPAYESDEPTFYEVIPEQTIPALVSYGTDPKNIPPSDGLCELDDAIRQHIEKALSKSRGQVEGKRGAAQMLGINPHTLRAKMRKLGIQWDRFREA